MIDWQFRCEIYIYVWWWNATGLQSVGETGPTVTFRSSSDVCGLSGVRVLDISWRSAREQVCRGPQWPYMEVQHCLHRPSSAVSGKISLTLVVSQRSEFMRAKPGTVSQKIWTVKLDVTNCSAVGKSQDKYVYGAVKIKERQVLISRSIQSLGLLKVLLHFTSPADLFNQIPSQTSLGSIQPHATINARWLLIHIVTTVYSQVLIYTAEWTGAM